MDAEETTIKPAVSWAEAAAKIVPGELEAALLKISMKHESNEKKGIKKEPKYGELMEDRLLEIIDYLGIEFSGISPPAEFPWLNMYKLVDVIDLPISYLATPVYQVLVEWLDQFSTVILTAFVLWAFKYICNQIFGIPNTTRSHEAIYVVLALVLRRKPLVMTKVLPFLSLWNETDQEPNKLPLTVWMMAQASRGNLYQGFYSWVHKLLPVLAANKNPQTTDLILQFVENILSTPKAQPVLVSRAAAKGADARLIPPLSFEILLHLTFPAPSARDEYTERFEAIYPLLKDVALAGAPRSDPMKLVTQQIFSLSLKLAEEDHNPVLAKEATALAFWSLTENIECYSLWDSLYEENLEASIALLKMLADEFKYHSFKLLLPSYAPTLNQAITSFRIKNELSITQGAPDGSLYIKPDKPCKLILGSRFTAVITVVLAFAAAVLFFNPETATELKYLVDSLCLYPITN